MNININMTCFHIAGWIFKFRVSVSNFFHNSFTILVTIFCIFNIFMANYLPLKIYHIRIQDHILITLKNESRTKIIQHSLPPLYLCLSVCLFISLSVSLSLTLSLSVLSQVKPYLALDNTGSAGQVDKHHSKTDPGNDHSCLVACLLHHVMERCILQIKRIIINYNLQAISFKKPFHISCFWSSNLEWSCYESTN